jgi:hypothetical protein
MIIGHKLAGGQCKLALKLKHVRGAASCSARPQLVVVAAAAARAPANGPQIDVGGQLDDVLVRMRVGRAGGSTKRKPAAAKPGGANAKPKKELSAASGKRNSKGGATGKRATAAGGAATHNEPEDSLLASLTAQDMDRLFEEVERSMEVTDMELVEVDADDVHNMLGHGSAQLLASEQGRPDRQHEAAFKGFGAPPRAQQQDQKRKPGQTNTVWLVQARTHMIHTHVDGFFGLNM